MNCTDSTNGRLNSQSKLFFHIFCTKKYTNCIFSKQFKTPSYEYCGSYMRRFLFWLAPCYSNFLSPTTGCNSSTNVSVDCFLLVKAFSNESLQALFLHKNPDFSKLPKIVLSFSNFQYSSASYSGFTSLVFSINLSILINSGVLFVKCNCTKIPLVHFLTNGWVSSIKFFLQSYVKSI